MFKQFREIQRGEFFLIAGDCSQGGKDANAAQFFSHTKVDVPLIYHAQGVAAQMTPEIHRVATKISDVTGVPPVVCLERNNGGASEMERLRVLNRDGKYTLFVMPTIGLTKQKDTTKLGWDTTSVSRPIALGELKNAIDSETIGLYDMDTIRELFWFIINEQGKPEAMKTKHDDRVMSLAIAWQMYKFCGIPQTDYNPRKDLDANRNWSLSDNYTPPVKDFRIGR